jgi:hypothetical protein
LPDRPFAGRPQFELLDLAAGPPRRAAELRPAQLGNLELELPDLQCPDLHRHLCRLQRALTGQREGAQGVRIVGQFAGGEQHARNYQGQGWQRKEAKESEPCQTSTGCYGNGGATVRRQSIASASRESCAGVNIIAPSTTGGRTKRPG